MDYTMNEFAQHHANLVVNRLFDDETETEYEIVGHIGPDHYAHADNLAKVGYDKLIRVTSPEDAPICVI